MQKQTGVASKAKASLDQVFAVKQRNPHGRRLSCYIGCIFHMKRRQVCRIAICMCSLLALHYSTCTYNYIRGARTDGLAIGYRINLGSNQLADLCPIGGYKVLALALHNASFIA